MSSKKDGWAVGSFYDGSEYKAMIQRWDGVSWSLYPAPETESEGSSLRALDAISSDDVWTVGSKHGGGRCTTLTEHWDGTAWSVIESPNAATCSGLNDVAAVSSDDVWAVGNATSRAASTLIMRWNGERWSVVPSPNGIESGGYNVLNSVAAVSANDVWAVGYYFRNPDGVRRLMIQHWDGIAWRMVPVPSTVPSNALLGGIAAVSSDDVWAVGYSGTGELNAIDPLAMRWNGTRWSVVPVPSPGVGASLSDLTALSSSNIWAVGVYYLEDPKELRTLAVHWNGERWVVASTPNPPGVSPGGGLYGVDATPSGEVWAAGSAYDTKPHDVMLTVMQRYGIPFCNDSVDNDGDGKSDYPGDPGCTSYRDGSEIGTVECDDAADNDLDAKIDYRVDGTGDSGCSSPADESELLPL